MQTCPKCNGPMEALLTSVVCRRDCEALLERFNQRFLADCTPCTEFSYSSEADSPPPDSVWVSLREDIQRSLLQGKAVLNLPPGCTLEYGQQAEAYVLKVTPPAYAQRIECELTFACDESE